MSGETSKESAVADTASKISSAPELPRDVAAQFGLPHNEATETSAISEKDMVIEDPKTDAAVSDIQREEGDTLLAVRPGDPAPLAPPVYRKRSLGRFFRAWWRNKWTRWVSLALLVAMMAVVFSVQKLRYAVLNAAGVRSAASVVVLDDTTKLPLRNVAVTIGDKRTLTDITGRAQFKELRLGNYDLTIERIAFAAHKQTITIGWGSNPLGEFKLKATGLQYELSITDYVSGRPVEGAEVVQDGFNALSDASGKVMLTVENTDIAKLSVVINAEGYRTEARELDAASTTATAIVLVPSQKHVFVSKQSGKYDVLSVDVDGKNRKILLAGTGNETPSVSLAVSSDRQYAAYVSTRDNIRDADGYLLSALTIINLKAGTSVTVDHAEQLQLVDWIGDRLVYRVTIAGASAADPQRNRIIALKYETNSRAQLATANQFNAILSAKGYIYYGVSSTDPDATLGLFRVKPDGSGRKQLSGDEVWAGVRAAYDLLSIQTPEGWQIYSLKDEKFTETEAPSSLSSFTFVEDPSGKQSAWTDIQDGKGALLLLDITRNARRTLAVQEGLTNPVRWLNNTTLVYRVSIAGETADYVLSSYGGQARKITDVVPSFGYAQAY